jgi:hypothetical protein
MGIRYYAYAFDADLTEAALAHPRRFLSADPLADTWGMEPGAVVSVATFQQTSPKREMLYLDKAWRELQIVTAPADGKAGRPAHRMFEGQVTHTRDGWLSWVKTLAPDEIPAISADLASIEEGSVRGALQRRSSQGDESLAYALQYLEAARDFTASLVGDGRGMVYMIG